MASTQRNITCNIGEIIDVIDLTDETFFNETLPYNNVLENYSNFRNSPSQRQLFNLRIDQEQTSNQLSTVLGNIATTISLSTSRNINRRRNRNNGNERYSLPPNRNRTNASVIEEPEEIYLDDTVVSGTNGPWCVNDTCIAEPTILTCAICLEELKAKLKPTATNCGHVFCENCLIKVINDKKKCPTCQSRISKKSFRRLYF
ncbi:hypothetical protein M0802_010478 [Mischocyttarus mexicanus]|nr:hypothetical protein M0802_010478 [Mischocyttarus mexicanus]